MRGMLPQIRRTARRTRPARAAVDGRARARGLGLGARLAGARPLRRAQRAPRRGCCGRTPLARRVVIQLGRALAGRPRAPARRPAGRERQHDRPRPRRLRPDGSGAGNRPRRPRGLGDRPARGAPRPGYDEPCWGYHFDVETRFFFYSARHPEHDRDGLRRPRPARRPRAARQRARPRARRRAPASSSCAEIERTAPARGAGAYLGYFPGDRTPIHNASMLAASVLARLGADHRPRRLRRRRRDAVAYCLAHQRDDGSWPYAEGDDRRLGRQLPHRLRARRAAPLRRAPSTTTTPAPAGRAGCATSASGSSTPTAPRATPTRAATRSTASASPSRSRRSPLGSRIDPELLGRRPARRLDFGVARMRRADGAFAFQRHRHLVNRARTSAGSRRRCSARTGPPRRGRARADGAAR